MIAHPGLTLNSRLVFRSIGFDCDEASRPRVKASARPPSAVARRVSEHRSWQVKFRYHARPVVQPQVRHTEEEGESMNEGLSAIFGLQTACHFNTIPLAIGRDNLPRRLLSITRKNG